MPSEPQSVKIPRMHGHIVAVLVVKTFSLYKPKVRANSMKYIMHSNQAGETNNVIIVATPIVRIYRTNKTLKRTTIRVKYLSKRSRLFFWRKIRKIVMRLLQTGRFTLEPSSQVGSVVRFFTANQTFRYVFIEI